MIAVRWSLHDRGASHEQCIRCGLCRSGAPSFRAGATEASTAKGRNILLQARAPLAELQEVLWDCTGCGYCDAICPKDINNTGIMTGVRGRAIAAFGPPEHLVALCEQRRATGNVYSADREPFAVAGRSTRRALFLGCAARSVADAGAIAEAVRRVAGDVELVVNEGCCGAPFADSGWSEAAEEARRTLNQALFAHDEIIVASSACARALAAETRSKVRHLAEVLLSDRLAQLLSRRDLLIAPCRAVNQRGDKDTPVRLAIERIAAASGCATNLDAARLASCCGADPARNEPPPGSRDVWADLLFAREVERVVVLCSTCERHVKAIADRPVIHAAALIAGP